MDRFIGYRGLQSLAENKDLKSNMDRFIALTAECKEWDCGYLKSNMDRFIGTPIKNTIDGSSWFKIQYG